MSRECSREAMTKEEWNDLMKKIKKVEPQLELTIYVSRYHEEMDIEDAYTGGRPTYVPDKDVKNDLEKLVGKYGGSVEGPGIISTIVEQPRFFVKIPFKKREKFLTELKKGNYVRKIEIYEAGAL